MDKATSSQAEEQVQISPQQLDGAASKIKQLIRNIEVVIYDKQAVIEMMLAGLLADGHVLLEDVPGVGKTMLARTLAKSLNCEFKRIQFTPDLLPADVTGSNTYNQKTMEFSFRQGPIFSNILLADEINRTSPRTQSALLEGMEERQVTVDGRSHALPRPFFVIATQNPIEQQGTYDLPEAQLDRFMLRVAIGYPSVDREQEILEAQREANPIQSLESVATTADVVEMQGLVRQVFVKPSLRRYIAELSLASREHSDVQVGVSVRGSQLLMRAAQAMALISHRAYVIPDDIQLVAPACLKHRLIIRPESRLGGVDEGTVLDSLFNSVPVPAQ